MSHNRDRGLLCIVALLILAIVALPTQGGDNSDELAAIVKKLGGKLKRLDYDKDRVAFEVDLKGTKTSDADLAVLGKIPGIHTLDLSFTQVTDEGLASFAGYKDLRHLTLMGTKVTDAAIVPLSRILNLYTLNVAKTAVTDKGVALFAKGREFGRYGVVCRVA